MTTDSQWDIQTAIYEVLTNRASLTTLLKEGANSIFDTVPDNSGFPYCVIANMSASAMNTQASTGLKVEVSIECLSKTQGAKELKAIMSAIYEALDQVEITLTNHDVISSRFVSSRIQAIDGGKTRRSLQIFEIITEPK